jgi:hypothetical protein
MQYKDMVKRMLKSEDAAVFASEYVLMQEYISLCLNVEEICAFKEKKTGIE